MLKAKSLLNIDRADGIVEYPDEQLARDPSTIIGYPAPPGKHFFYVNELNQIAAGSQIFYSTEGETDPATVKVEMAQLFKAQKERNKYPEGSSLRALWDADVARLGNSLVTFWQGHRRIKSLRTVASVDKATGLVVVTEPFLEGYKPRVLGAVVRVVSFEVDQIDEIRTDRFHKAMAKHYGSTDWENDLKTHGNYLSRANGRRG